MHQVNAATRLNAASKDAAKALADLLAKSLEKAGYEAKIKENKLLNRTLKGPAGGAHFSVETDAFSADIQDMLTGAGWRDFRQKDGTWAWKKRGAPSLSLSSLRTTVTIWIF